MTAVNPDDFGLELHEVRRDLLRATQRQGRAIEAWALAVTRGVTSTGDLKRLCVERESAQTEVARLAALAHTLERAFHIPR